jgi:hypothetical protein
MTGIVLQGPTSFYKNVADFYCQFNNVVFSTWNTEPKENLEYIRSKGISVITSDLPNYSGHLNINYQVFSSLKGVEFLSQKGCSKAIKIRSDTIFYGLEKILEIIKDQDIAFLNLNELSYKCRSEYFLDYTHVGYDFTTDHVIYGKTNILQSTFDFQLKRDFKIPPESLILRNYLYTNGYDVNFSKENLKRSKVYLFGQDCLDNGCSILWLKANIDLVKLTHNPNEFFIAKL